MHARTMHPPTHPPTHLLEQLWVHLWRHHLRRPPLALALRGSALVPAALAAAGSGARGTHLGFGVDGASL